MEHDLRTLQVFLESELRADREARARMHQESTAANNKMVAELAKVTAQTTATNGRVTKLEVTMAVLKFAVFTIGGGLLVAGLQVLITKLTAVAP